MKNLQVIQKQPTMTIPDLIADAGIEIDRLPAMFGECFDEKLPGGVLAGLSKIIRKAIPDEIDGIYTGIDEIANLLLNAENVQRSKSLKEYRSIVAPCLKKAIAFIILDRHPQSDRYPMLMQMRRVIHANKELCRVSAKGGHRGLHGNDVQDAFNKAACAKGIVQIPVAAFAAMYEYLATQAILAEDETAKTIVKMVNPNRRLLLS